MDIKEYVKQFNKTFIEVKTEYADEFKSMWDYENKWYQPLEKKSDLIKDASDRLSIENVISKIRDSNYIFTEDDTESLCAFTSNINTLVRIANRINNFREGVELDNGNTLSLYNLFNRIKVTSRLDSFNYPLNSNLNSFLPHLFSVVKYCQNPQEYPVHYKFGKNIIREVLGKDDDYDRICDFYRTFPESDRLLNFYVYIGTIGMLIAKNISQSGLLISKDSRDYKYLTENLINVQRYIDILDQNLAVKMEDQDETLRIVLISVIKKIDNELAIRKFFKSVQRILSELQLTNKDQLVYASALNSNLQFTIGGRCVVNVERKNNQVLLGFYIKDEFIDVLKLKYSNLIFSKEPSEKNTERSWVKIDPQNANVDDFYQGILALANESKKVQTKSQYRSQFSEKHNPWIIEAALNESVLNSLFTNEKFELKPAKMNLPLNIILYGPPGTGKTYNSIDKAVEIAAPGRYVQNDHNSNKTVFDELRKLRQIEFITFHQNYSYEDFVVGITPDVTSSSLRFDKRDGVFKNLADEARKNWLSSSKSEQSEIDFDYVFNAYFRSLIEEEVSEKDIPMKSKNYSFKVTAIDFEDHRIKFRKKSGGTGHDLLIKNVKKIFEGTHVYGTEGLGVYYNPLNEQLKEFAKSLTPRQASTEQLRNFILVIDEINRANISKVFGELITLLEDDKRLGAENELRVTLPNGEEDFGIPPNLYIIGTMNTADKSIALIDIALRRRFEFIGYYPKYYGYDQEACNLLKIINANIFDKKKSADYLIGHAYFMKGQSIETVLKNKVIPLLMEYFSGKIEIVKDIFSGSKWNINYDSTTYSWIIKEE